MAYSTGRGGAGNIHHSKNKTSENNVISPQTSKVVSPQTSHQDHSLHKTTSNNKKVYYSTGRGGAGNIQSSSQIPSPKLAPQGSNTPHLTTSKVSTGRGGYGNMVNNDDPELTRKLQDVDGRELYPVTSSKSFSVGRGGFGNVVSNSRSNDEEEEVNGHSLNKSTSPNLYAVSSHPEKKKKKGGLLDKIKDIFK